MEELPDKYPLETFPFNAHTAGVTVRVGPVYIEVLGDDLEEEGEAEAEPRHTWAYYVQIENDSGQTIQLLNRYWRIVDANGMVEEIHGAGVVGEQPILHPQESFEYQSFATLDTSSGFMNGYYDFALPNGDKLQVTIPAFSLDAPGIHALN